LSRFGRRFGAFWYRFHTGLIIHDTQCGFRAYPLESILPLETPPGRYEFEIDVLIAAAWSGIAVKEIPVHRYYQPREQRVSHFRPFRDFLRCTRVNSRAALIRIFCPWRFIDAPGASWREKLIHLFKREFTAGLRPRRAAAALATGVCFGILPIHGFQVVSVIALSVLFHLNRPLILLGVSVSSAPFLPFLIAAGLGLGKIVLPADTIAIVADTTGKTLLVGLIQWAVGSVVLAVGAAVATYALSYPFFRKLIALQAGRNARRIARLNSDGEKRP
jgi:uncharacterized protein (DUF2062 family)